MQSEKTKATILLLNANIIWGITPLFLEVILKYVSPLQATTMRFGIAAITLSILLYLTKGRGAFSFLSTRTIILLGWLDAFGYLAMTIGQDITSPGLSTLLSSFYVFIVPFIAWKLEGTRIYKRIIILGSFSLMGVFFICFNGDWSNLIDSSIIGIGILMFSAIMWGFYTVISGKFLNIRNSENKNIDLLNFTNASLVHTFLALSILSIFTEEPYIFFPVEIIPYLLFAGLFPTIIALGLWNWSIARLGSINTSFYQLLQIIIPFVLEFFLLHQQYTSWIYIGIFIIIIATFWINEYQTIEDHQSISVFPNDISTTGSYEAGKEQIDIYCL